MRRRHFALSLASLTSLLVLPLRKVRGQLMGPLPKLAILSPATPAQIETPAHVLHMLLRGLAELGYVDGQNILFELRFAHNELERIPALAAELVATQPDVLYTWTTGAGRAVASATSTIPIVLAPVAEATMSALVPDMAHPSGNITGLTISNHQRHEKCLQLLKEVTPHVLRIGVLLNPLNPAWDDYPGVLAGAAQALNVELVRVEARGAPEINRAFAAMDAEGVDALFGLDESTLAGARPVPKRLMELLARDRLPSISDAQGFARAGGLLSLETDEAIIARGAADYIHRILQGTKVAELPVEHPAMFKLAVNLKTAQELGITIPPSVLLRADEVIE